MIDRVRHIAILCSAALFVTMGTALASQFHAIHQFAGSPTDGGQPVGTLVRGTGGVLYGTTEVGGASNAGTVFALKPPAAPGSGWSSAVLYSFLGAPDGRDPQSGVVIGPGGVLYGVTAEGGRGTAPSCFSGCGTVFALTPPATAGGSWTASLLYSFSGLNDGGLPGGPLLIGGGGVLYGSTFQGGNGACPGGCGTIFSLTPPATAGGTWTQSVLYNFGTAGEGAGPAGPNGGLTMRAGVLFGTTLNGGIGSCPKGCGTVFSLTPPTTPGGAWIEQTLHQFSGGSDGGNPEARVTIDNQGLLYGTTRGGGNSGCPNGCGTVYTLAPPSSPGGAWTESVVYAFPGVAGPTGRSAALPLGNLLVTSRGITGTTTNGMLQASEGSVFELLRPASPNGAWTPRVIYNFTKPHGGFEPQGLLLERGVLFGATVYSHQGNCPASGCGMIYKIVR